MTFPVVTRPAAAEEIETAPYRWYEKEREGLGSEFLEALENMVKTIAENPERFPTIRKDIRRALLHRFPYSILYRIVSGHVVVIACFHGKRDPRVWRSASSKQLTHDRTAECSP